MNVESTEVHVSKKILKPDKEQMKSPFQKLQAQVMKAFFYLFRELSLPINMQMKLFQEVAKYTYIKYMQHIHIPKVFLSFRYLLKENV